MKPKNVSKSATREPVKVMKPKPYRVKTTISHAAGMHVERAALDERRTPASKFREIIETWHSSHTVRKEN